jgi:hypothetical protein
MDQSEALVIPEGLENGELGMETEMTIEIDQRLFRDRDPGPFPVVLLIAVRNDHAEAIDRTALEKTDESSSGLGLRASGLGPERVDGSIQEQRIEAKTHQAQGSAS